MLNRNNCELQT